MKFTVSAAFLAFDELVPVARCADELGYSALALVDHLVHFDQVATAYPYSEDGQRPWTAESEWPDPWVVFGALGMVTSRLRFFTSIYVPALRSPFQVAKAVGTASLLTGGRVSLGAGVGWCREEFELVGESFQDRGRRTDEALDLISRLWGPGWTQQDGGFYPTPPVAMNPRPTARIPVLIGGLSEVAMRRAARHDGWVGDLCTTDQAIERAQRLSTLQAEAGDSRPLDVIVSLTDAFLPSEFRRAEAGGVTGVMTMPWVYYYGLECSVEEKQEGLRRFHRQVVRKVDGS